MREIELDSVAELAGLPADWIAAHPPDETGKIHINTDYPDYIPFITFARNGPARKALYLEFKDRGYPDNMEVLSALIAKRYELARILGYDHWADYITADKMMGSAANAAEFIDKVSAVAGPPAQRDYAVLLERKRRVAPAATKVADWEKTYYAEAVKSEQYQFDSKTVRPYFEFSRVQQGLFDLTSQMFGIEYRQVMGLNLWHQDVTAWDVYEGDQRLGRFYLDLRPRPNKYKHAACFGCRAG
ncbi:MAG: peptidase M3, partial [Proteobacteria bacterium]|nr:peptidase M3 [Pseudomonadota bacterium]